MSKLVIYDDKNILIADLDKTDKRIVKSKKEIKGVPFYEAWYRNVNTGFIYFLKSV